MAKIENETKIVGNLARIDELKTRGENSIPVITFGVAVTPSRREGNEWVDGDTIWFNLTAWNKLAENISKLRTGDRVIVLARTVVKAAYTDKDGVERPQRNEYVANFVGLDLTFNSARSDRPDKKTDSSESSNPAPKKKAKKTDDEDYTSPIKNNPLDDDDDDDGIF